MATEVDVAEHITEEVVLSPSGPSLVDENGHNPSCEITTVRSNRATLESTLKDVNTAIVGQPDSSGGQFFDKSPSNTQVSVKDILDCDASLREQNLVEKEKEAPKTEAISQKYQAQDFIDKLDENKKLSLEAKHTDQENVIVIKDTTDSTISDYRISPHEMSSKASSLSPELNLTDNSNEKYPSAPDIGIPACPELVSENVTIGEQENEKGRQNILVETSENTAILMTNEEAVKGTPKIKGTDEESSSKGKTETGDEKKESGTKEDLETHQEEKEQHPITEPDAIAVVETKQKELEKPILSVSEDKNHEPSNEILNNEEQKEDTENDIISTKEIMQEDPGKGSVDMEKSDRDVNCIVEFTTEDISVEKNDKHKKAESTLETGNGVQAELPDNSSVPKEESNQIAQTPNITEEQRQDTKLKDQNFDLSKEISIEYTNSMNGNPKDDVNSECLVLNEVSESPETKGELGRIVTAVEQDTENKHMDNESVMKAELGLNSKEILQEEKKHHIIQEATAEFPPENKDSRLDDLSNETEPEHADSEKLPDEILSSSGATELVEDGLNDKAEQIHEKIVATEPQDENYATGHSVMEAQTKTTASEQKLHNSTVAPIKHESADEKINEQGSKPEIDSENQETNSEALYKCQSCETVDASRETDDDPKNDNNNDNGGLSAPKPKANEKKEVHQGEEQMYGERDNIIHVVEVCPLVDEKQVKDTILEGEPTADISTETVSELQKNGVPTVGGNHELQIGGTKINSNDSLVVNQASESGKINEDRKHEILTDTIKERSSAEDTFEPKDPVQIQSETFQGRQQQEEKVEEKTIFETGDEIHYSSSEPDMAPASTSIKKEALNSRLEKEGEDKSSAEYAFEPKDIAQMPSETLQERKQEQKVEEEKAIFETGDKIHHSSSESDMAPASPSINKETSKSFLEKEDEDKSSAEDAFEPKDLVQISSETFQENQQEQKLEEEKTVFETGDKIHYSSTESGMAPASPSSKREALNSFVEKEGEDKSCAEDAFEPKDLVHIKSETSQERQQEQKIEDQKAVSETGNEIHYNSSEVGMDSKTVSLDADTTSSFVEHVGEDQKVESLYYAVLEKTIGSPSEQDDTVGLKQEPLTEKAEVEKELGVVKTESKDKTSCSNGEHEEVSSLSLNQEASDSFPEKAFDGEKSENLSSVELEKDEECAFRQENSVEIQTEASQEHHEESNFKEENVISESENQTVESNCEYEEDPRTLSMNEAASASVIEKNHEDRKVENLSNAVLEKTAKASVEQQDLATKQAAENIPLNEEASDSEKDCQEMKFENCCDAVLEASENSNMEVQDKIFQEPGKIEHKFEDNREGSEGEGNIGKPNAEFDEISKQVSRCVMENEGSLDSSKKNHEILSDAVLDDVEKVAVLQEDSVEIEREAPQPQEHEKVDSRLEDKIAKSESKDQTSKTNSNEEDTTRIFTQNNEELETDHKCISVENPSDIVHEEADDDTNKLDDLSVKNVASPIKYEEQEDSSSENNFESRNVDPSHVIPEEPENITVEQDDFVEFEEETFQRKVEEKQEVKANGSESKGQNCQPIVEQVSINSNLNEEAADTLEEKNNQEMEVEKLSDAQHENPESTAGVQIQTNFQEQVITYNIIQEPRADSESDVHVSKPRDEYEEITSFNQKKETSDSILEKDDADRKVEITSSTTPEVSENVTVEQDDVSVEHILTSPSQSKEAGDSFPEKDGEDRKIEIHSNAIIEELEEANDKQEGLAAHEDPKFEHTPTSPSQNKEAVDSFAEKDGKDRNVEICSNAIIEELEEATVKQEDLAEKPFDAAHEDSKFEHTPTSPRQNKEAVDSVSEKDGEDRNVEICSNAVIEELEEATVKQEDLAEQSSNAAHEGSKFEHAPTSPSQNKESVDSVSEKDGEDRNIEICSDAIIEEATVKQEDLTEKPSDAAHEDSKFKNTYDTAHGEAEMATSEQGDISMKLVAESLALKEHSNSFSEKLYKNMSALSSCGVPEEPEKVIAEPEDIVEMRVISQEQREIKKKLEEKADRSESKDQDCQRNAEYEVSRSLLNEETPDFSQERDLEEMELTKPSDAVNEPEKTVVKQNEHQAKNVETISNRMTEESERTNVEHDDLSAKNTPASRSMKEESSDLMPEKDYKETKVKKFSDAVHEKPENAAVENENLVEIQTAFQEKGEQDNILEERAKTQSEAQTTEIAQYEDIPRLSQKEEALNSFQEKKHEDENAENITMKGDDEPGSVNDQHGDLSAEYIPMNHSMNEEVSNSFQEKYVEEIKVENLSNTVLDAPKDDNINNHEEMQGETTQNQEVEHKLQSGTGYQDFQAKYEEVQQNHRQNDETSDSFQDHEAREIESLYNSVPEKPEQTTVDDEDPNRREPLQKHGEVELKQEDERDGGRGYCTNVELEEGPRNLPPIEEASNSFPDKDDKENRGESLSNIVTEELEKAMEEKSAESIAEQRILTEIQGENFEEQCEEKGRSKEEKTASGNVIQPAAESKEILGADDAQLSGKEFFKSVNAMNENNIINTEKESENHGNLEEDQDSTSIDESGLLVTTEICQTGNSRQDEISNSDTSPLSDAQSDIEVNIQTERIPSAKNECTRMENEVTKTEENATLKEEKDTDVFNLLEKEMEAQTIAEVDEKYYGKQTWDNDPSIEQENLDICLQKEPEESITCEFLHNVLLEKPIKKKMEENDTSIECDKDGTPDQVNLIKDFNKENSSEEFKNGENVNINVAPSIHTLEVATAEECTERPEKNSFAEVPAEEYIMEHKSENKEAETTKELHAILSGNAGLSNEEILKEGKVKENVLEVSCKHEKAPSPAVLNEMIEEDDSKPEGIKSTKAHGTTSASDTDVPTTESTETENSIEKTETAESSKGPKYRHVKEENIKLEEVDKGQIPEITNIEPKGTSIEDDLSHVAQLEQTVFSSGISDGRADELVYQEKAKLEEPRDKHDEDHEEAQGSDIIPLEQKLDRVDSNKMIENAEIKVEQEPGKNHSSTSGETVLKKTDKLDIIQACEAVNEVVNQNTGTEIVMLHEVGVGDVPTATCNKGNLGPSKQLNDVPVEEPEVMDSSKITEMEETNSEQHKKDPTTLPIAEETAKISNKFNNDSNTLATDESSKGHVEEGRGQFKDSASGERPQGQYEEDRVDHLEVQRKEASEASYRKKTRTSFEEVKDDDDDTVSLEQCDATDASKLTLMHKEQDMIQSTLIVIKGSAEQVSAKHESFSGPASHESIHEDITSEKSIQLASSKAPTLEGSTALRKLESLISGLVIDDTTDGTNQKDTVPDEAFNAIQDIGLAEDATQMENGVQQKASIDKPKEHLNENLLSDKVEEKNGSLPVSGKDQVKTENSHCMEAEEVQPKEKDREIEEFDTSQSARQEVSNDLPVSQFLMHWIMKENSLHETKISKIEGLTEEVTEAEKKTASIPEQVVPSNIMLGNQVKAETMIQDDNIESPENPLSNSILILEEREYDVNKDPGENKKHEGTGVAEIMQKTISNPEETTSEVVLGNQVEVETTLLEDNIESLEKPLSNCILKLEEKKYDVDKDAEDDKKEDEGVHEEKLDISLTEKEVDEADKDNKNAEAPKTDSWNNDFDQSLTKESNQEINVIVQELSNSDLSLDEQLHDTNSAKWGTDIKTVQHSECFNRNLDVATNTSEAEITPEEGKRDCLEINETQPVTEISDEILASKSEPANLGLIENEDFKCSTSSLEDLQNVSHPVTALTDEKSKDSQKDGETLMCELEMKAVNLKEEIRVKTEETSAEAKETSTDDPRKPKVGTIYLSALQHESLKETTQMAEQALEGGETVNKDELTSKDKTGSTRELGKCEEEKKKGIEEQKTEEDDPESPVMVEIHEVELKPLHKKHHNILSGVGSKVKHSIMSKVKKAITCTSVELPK